MNKNKIFNFIYSESDYSQIKNIDELTEAKRNLKREIKHSEKRLSYKFSNKTNKIYLRAIKPGYNMLTGVSKTLRYATIAYNVYKRIMKFVKRNKN